MGRGRERKKFRFKRIEQYSIATDSLKAKQKHLLLVDIFTNYL